MKREQFLRELRSIARQRSVEFSVVVTKGKGSHVTVYFGERATIIKHGELPPGYVRLVRKQLGI